MAPIKFKIVNTRLMFFIRLFQLESEDGRYKAKVYWDTEMKEFTYPIEILCKDCLDADLHITRHGGVELHLLGGVSLQKFPAVQTILEEAPQVAEAIKTLLSEAVKSEQ